MPGTGQIQQETVDGRTVTVHRLKNQFERIEETPYMYEIRVDGDAVGDPVFTRNEAMQEFDATIRGFEQPAGGLLGGSGGLFGGGDGLFGGGFR